MLVIREISWKNLNTFGDLADCFCKKVLYYCSLQNTKRVDFVCDSYFENLQKSSEHIRRCKFQCSEYTDFNKDMKLPKLGKQSEKFWGSSENKFFLQMFIRDYVCKQVDLNQYEIIFSPINDIPCLALNKNLTASFEDLQRFDIEEADVKIMVHLNHSAKEGFKNIYSISSDTDVIILTLYFFITFCEKGLELIIIFVKFVSII